MSGHAAVSAYGRLTGDPRTPDPLRFPELDRPEQPKPVPAGPVKITDADIPF